MRPQWGELLRGNRKSGGVDLPLSPDSLPIKEIANQLAARAGELGLTWRLVPATVAVPGAGGVMRVVLDGDTVPIDATSMIGRLPVGGRVFVILSPPAGVHIVGFLGYDFPPSVAGEAIGRPRLLSMGSPGFGTTSLTAVAVTGMSFTAAPNATYIIQTRLSVNGNTADDCGIGWTMPSGATMAKHYIGAPTGATAATISDVILGRVDNGSNLSLGLAASTVVNIGFWEDTLLKTAATGGTVQLTLNRINAVSGAVTIRSNSYFTVQRYR